jgi:hypothetical protein
MLFAPPPEAKDYVDKARDDLEDARKIAAMPPFR